LSGKLVWRFPTHHHSCKCKKNLTGEILALANKLRKTHELCLISTTLLKTFEGKRLTFPEPLELIWFSCEFYLLRGAVFVHGSAKLCMEMVFRLTCAVLWEVAFLAQNVPHSGTRV